MNILLTSIGRRDYMVRYFKEALLYKGKVFTANSLVNTSGTIASDKNFLVPTSYTDGYSDLILDICIKNKVVLVVPLLDIDLDVFTKARHKFEKVGIHLLVSDQWVIEISNDKWLTYQFFKKNKFCVPITYTSLRKARNDLSERRITFPLVVKPRWGMSSRGFYVVENLQELNFFYQYVKKKIESSCLLFLSKEKLNKSVIIQEFISGPEYNLDIFNNLEGNHLITVPKQKLEMRAGETDSAYIVNDKKLIDMGKKISSLLRHRGNLDVDIFKNERKEIYLLEVNARFGGGYPFSHMAGAKFTHALIKMINGKPVSFKNIKFNTLGFKAIKPIIIKKPNV